jgi:hypothetical protein
MGEVRVDVRDPVHGEASAHIIARPVHLDRLDNHLPDGRENADECDRVAFAHELIFGHAYTNV